jgi:hypothetical protein
MLRDFGAVPTSPPQLPPSGREGSVGDSSLSVRPPSVTNNPIIVDRNVAARPRQTDNRAQTDTCLLKRKPNEIHVSLGFHRFASVLAPKLKRISTRVAHWESVGSSPTGATPLANESVSFTNRPLTEFYHARLPVSNHAFSSRFARHLSTHRQPQAASFIASDPNECEVSHVG